MLFRSEVRGQTIPTATPGVDQRGNQPLANEPTGGKRNKNKGNEVREQMTPGVGQPGNEPLPGEPARGKGNRNKPTEVRGQTMPGVSTPRAGEPGLEPLTGQPGGGKGKPKGASKRDENIASERVQPPTAAGNPPAEGRPNHKPERMNPQRNPAGPPPPGFNAAGGGKRSGEVQGQGQGQPQGPEAKGKKNKGQPSPPPPLQ